MFYFERLLKEKAKRAYAEQLLVGLSIRNCLLYTSKKSTECNVERFYTNWSGREGLSRPFLFHKKVEDLGTKWEYYQRNLRPSGHAVSYTHLEAARKVCQADDNVDAMFSKIVLEVCGIITENPQNVMCDVDLIFITKYVERMADHATNIAEMCIRERCMAAGTTRA